MKDANCIFCKIGEGTIPSHKVYEDDDFLGFLDVAPAAEGHMLLIPKNHFRDAGELPEKIAAKMLPIASSLGEKAKKVLGAQGYNLLFNTGGSAGQTVFHCHMHIIPRKQGDGALLLWEPKTAAQEELKNLAKILLDGGEK